MIGIKKIIIAYHLPPIPLGLKAVPIKLSVVAIGAVSLISLGSQVATMIIQVVKDITPAFVVPLRLDEDNCQCN